VGWMLEPLPSLRLNAVLLFDFAVSMSARTLGELRRPNTQHRAGVKHPAYPLHSLHALTPKRYEQQLPAERGAQDQLQPTARFCAVAFVQTHAIVELFHSIYSLQSTAQHILRTPVGAQTRS
jgi:hypothetical protein